MESYPEKIKRLEDWFLVCHILLSASYCWLTARSHGKQLADQMQVNHFNVY